MRHTVGIDSANTTHFGCYYLKVRYTDHKTYSKNVSSKRQQNNGNIFTITWNPRDNHFVEILQ